MKFLCKIVVGSLSCVGLVLPLPAKAGASKDARVTQIIRDVKLLPAGAAARAAAVNDKVSEDTGVRTGGDSRSELTFSDLTITRLGANTVFSFSKAGRTANVDTGSILLRVPKDSGGGSIRNNVVTVAVTGTTVIFEAPRGGHSKLFTLEGSSRVSLKKNPGEFRKVAAGQMIDVPAGATTLPMPVNFDVNQLMQTHPLITDFKPLPSLPLIMAVAQQPPPPSYRGPNIVFNPPFFNPRPNRGPGPGPAPAPPTTKPPVTNQPPRPITTQPPGNTKPPSTPTPPPIITRTGPKQTTYVPPKTQTTTRTQKVAKKPTPPPVR